MRILSKRRLREFWERHPKAAAPLSLWYARVHAADWSGPADIKRDFGTTVDFVRDNRVIFDIGGNKFRIVAYVAFDFGRVLVKFVGTHAEYDEIDAEDV